MVPLEQSRATTRLQGLLLALELDRHRLLIRARLDTRARRPRDAAGDHADLAEVVELLTALVTTYRLNELYPFDAVREARNTSHRTKYLLAAIGPKSSGRPKLSRGEELCPPGN